MKQYKATILFGVVVAITVGLLGVNGLFALPGSSATTNTMSDDTPIFGHVTLTLYDENGNIKSYRQGDNLVVNVGENCIAESIFKVDELASFSCGGTSAGGVSATGFQWVGIGTSSTNPANTDQNLGTLVEQRWQDSSLTFTSSTGTGSSSAIVVVDAAVPITATRTITEAGLFDATGTSGGNMFSRQTFTGISVVSGDSLTVRWTITIGG